MKVNSTLTFFNLARNKLGDSGASSLADALKTGGNLKELVLWGNDITDPGVKAIGNALNNNSYLQSLDLGICKIRDIPRNNGTVALAKSLGINSVLTMIMLNENEIGDIGAKALGDAFKVNSTLTALNLNSNKIGDKGASAIAEGLKMNSGLLTLYLVCNPIGEVGTKALKEGLQNNTTLSTLVVKSLCVENEIKDFTLPAKQTVDETSEETIEQNSLAPEITRGLTSSIIRVTTSNLEELETISEDRKSVV